MPIEIIKGDLLDAFDRGEVNVIGHVVNCQGVMGSGIAKSIKERYKIAYLAYHDLVHTQRKEKPLLGQSQWVCTHPAQTQPDKKYVVNLFAQENYGTHKRQLNYGAIGQALFDMADNFNFPWYRIGFPYKMGCDRAGGDFEIVYEMIEFYFKDYNVRIYQL